MKRLGNTHINNGESRRVGQTIRFAMVCTLLGLTGCTSLSNYDYGAIPVNRVPLQFLQTDRKDDLQEIAFQRLRRDPPKVYQLDQGDILGVYIENVIGNSEELPPVNYPEDASLPPAIGFPVPIREDGTVALPLVPPIEIAGMTLIQATDAIRRAYTLDQEILKDGKDRVIVTLIRRRTVRVYVVREESGGIAEVTKKGAGHVLDLPAYQNDVLHALTETGGMPGSDAKNEVLIYRGGFEDAVEYERIVNQLRQQRYNPDPCYCDQTPTPDPPNLIRIPLRYDPMYAPQFTQDDIILDDNDIVVIKGREDEVFYTGGLLSGGEIPLPRDKDLDILGAIALAGGSIGQGGSGAFGQAGVGRGGFGGGVGVGGGGGQCGPSELIVLRKLPCDQQIAFKVDLNKALRDPRQRVLVQPNDVLILRYTLHEEFTNFTLGIVQNNLLFLGLNRLISDR